MPEDKPDHFEEFLKFPCEMKPILSFENIGYIMHLGKLGVDEDFYSALNTSKYIVESSTCISYITWNAGCIF